MKTQLETIAVPTVSKQQMIDVTSQIRDRIAASGIRNGFVGVFSQHTTAGLMVNECQPALLDDIGEFLGRVVEEGLPYKHNSPLFSDCTRQNATSHLRSVLFNNSIFLPVADGKPVLGEFQSVILAELD